MKRIRNAVTAVAMLLCMAVCCTGCYEGSPDKGGAMATAIGLGHGNCITEVTVAVDGNGKLTKVVFDDIFPVTGVCNNTALGVDAPIVEIGTKKYYQYLRIGDKYFEVQQNGNYDQIGAANGITDLATYCTTEAGVQWYYDSFVSGVMQICKVSDDGVQAGDVKLAKAYNFNTSNGSMRKRYSRYWSASGTGSIGQVTGRGFNGNMEALETYLLAYGFDGVGDITLPNANNPYNVIGGVTTGATLSADTALYLNVAKKAYDKAIAMQG